MYLTENLNSSHDRDSFSCGKEPLDIYLKTQASQDVKRKLSACFIMADDGGVSIMGFYTLSSAGIPLEFVPDSIKEKLPKSYKIIPATLLGRLAINVDYQNQGIGRLLIIDALKRSYTASKIIGSFAVIVDPLDTKAESFYCKYGFIKLPDSGKMFLPMKTIEKLFNC